MKVMYMHYACANNYMYVFVTVLSSTTTIYTIGIYGDVNDYLTVCSTFQLAFSSITTWICAFLLHIGDEGLFESTPKTIC